MKMRNLDGVYFRAKRDGKWDNICFTDLYDYEANEILISWEDDQLERSYNVLTDILNDLKDSLTESELYSVLPHLTEISGNETPKFKVLATKYNIRYIADKFDIYCK